MNNRPKRYRTLGYFKTSSEATTCTQEYVSKGETIFQCDTLDEALNQVKTISESHPECTRFEIERGAWL